MSCGNPTVETDALMQRRKKYDKAKNCVKCKDAQGNIVIRHAVYCKGCFVPLITHKFRRALEPTVNARPDGPRRTALKPTGNLLVAFSGGLGSSVLLDLVHRCYVALDAATMPAEGGKMHPRHERVWKKVAVCYVEVCDAFPGMQDRTEEIAAHVARYDELEFVPLRLRNAFDRVWWEKVGGRPPSVDLGVHLSSEELPIDPHSTAHADPLASLRAYLSSLPTPTAIHTSVQTLIRLLLLHTAVQTESSHLLLGTSLTSLAVSLISGVAQGAGFNVREETMEEWSPDPDSPSPGPSSSPSSSATTTTTVTAAAASDEPPSRAEESKNEQGKKRKAKNTTDGEPHRRSLRIVRPLRDVGMKECAAWAWWSHVAVVGKEKWVWPGAKPGIGTLTKDFIVGLEQDYPSTVSTIVRTCGKLAPKGAVAGKCILCARPAQRGVQEWKARISIRSQPPAPPSPSPSPHIPISRSPPASTANANTTDPDPRPSLTPYLCYPCHTTLTSRGARAVSPPWPHPTDGSPVALPVWTEARLSTSSRGASLATNANGEVLHHKKVGWEEMRGIVDHFLLDE